MRTVSANEGSPDIARDSRLDVGGVNYRYRELFVSASASASEHPDGRVGVTVPPNRESPQYPDQHIVSDILADHFFLDFAVSNPIQ